MFTWEFSSLVFFNRIKYLDSNCLKRIGVNKGFGEQRVGLLPNFSKSERVGANGFDYLPD